MNRLFPVLVLAGLLLCTATVQSARAASRPHEIVSTVDVTFRLQVDGPSDRSLTYWVAYGPIQGKFVIRQLKAGSDGVYAVTERFPPHARTTLAYVAGHGTMHTRYGLVPGNPVVTIRETGPRVISPLNVPLVHWSRPVG